MSVEELRARIAAIDHEIELQKKLLERLEQDRVRALRQLNTALDPVARLPLEISSEIFLQSLATSPSGARGVPTVLLGIFNAWTDIALATPAMWMAVHIHFPCGDHFAKILPIWFQRAGNFPLSASISLCGHSTNWNHRVSDVLWRHGGQLKHLEILDDDDITTNNETLDLLGATAPVSLPLLETLMIRCQHQQRKYPSSQIFQLLGGAPNIVEFISDKVRTRNDLDLECLTVPTLRRVIFGETSSSDDEIFFYLVLPALETLSLPMCYISGSELLACIKRSAAPLQDLALGWKFGGMQSFQLHECLGLIPTLTRFKIWQPSVEAVTELFVALADSPSLLPNLHDLTVHLRPADHDAPNLPEFSWRTLIRALSTRRVEQLHIAPVATSPPMDVLASLRELATTGAKMHVGTEELNFVVA
ncbi:hypothetical protein MSAN_00438100 [Mycena sanguinolenta]|uniref:F-box domain-containing protein n=1 Tax=Mycena sanguinolenta TaxID=230812 RepID=A0A8H6ZFV4_9AGAR|nr:hypothetical protein MSAN_00438100 [Mycena sanguinolenta]